MTFTTSPTHDTPLQNSIYKMEINISFLAPMTLFTFTAYRYNLNDIKFKTILDGVAQNLIASLKSSAPFSNDLEEIQHILHFPEEVALRLTDAEYQLFYQVCESILNELKKMSLSKKKVLEKSKSL